MTTDPLADAPATCPTCPPELICPCPRCHGEAWLYVGDSYVDRACPIPGLLELAGLDDDTRDRVLAEAAATRAALANSVYPCPRCRPAQFSRWQGGHYDAAHDRSNCGECIDVLGGRRAVRRHPELVEPTRRDLA